MKRFSIQPGHEVRGLRIRLYPTPKDEAALGIIEADTRRAWNWLVKQTEDVLHARVAYALRNGLVGPRPTSPNCDGLSPEDTKSRHAEYRRECREWHGAVYTATNKVPACAFRSFRGLLDQFGHRHDYQMLTRVIGWGYPEEEVRKVRPAAGALQALTKNYLTKVEGQRRKKFRKAVDPMPLQTRTGVCFEQGSFGDRRGKPFYDCRVKFNGLKIRGRLPGRSPTGRVLEGVSIVKQADGWWASIKQEVPIRVPPPAVPGSVIGLDVGLDIVVAMSDGTKVINKRDKAYSERIAGRQATAMTFEEGDRRRRYERTTHRLQLRASRHAKHVLYNEVVKPLARVETIKVEKLTATIGQMGGSTKVSSMRTATQLLRERYGDRVREVLPHFTSQDCSQCGHRSKESWSYEHGRYGQCPACGYREDRDVNAARNIAAKAPIPLAGV